MVTQEVIQNNVQCFFHLGGAINGGGTRRGACVSADFTDDLILISNGSFFLNLNGDGVSCFSAPLSALLQDIATQWSGCALIMTKMLILLMRKRICGRLVLT